METKTHSYIRTNGIPLLEIAEKLSISRNTLRTRIIARGIKPIGKIGNAELFSPSDFEKIAEPGDYFPKTRNGKPLKRKEEE